MMDESVELRAWAERVLFGSTLADKLWSPAAFSDRQPGAALHAPPQPARPPGLELSEVEALVLPRELEDARSRGHLLHRFANHELLALELMALAILRFPEAPAAFRRGLARTLVDEQRHLQLYLERMRTLGVELGEQPLGAFFWRVMAPMPSPLDFMAHMALTFEQANLDFAQSYAATLRERGDETSAAILDQVRIDEIGHVKLGLVWFERWRERGPSLFEAHRSALRSPITLRRARGLGFDREGRSLAGLPDAYVERLALFEASRGRPPVVHLFDPCAELSLATRGAYTPCAVTQTMTEDLELLPVFMAAREDLVLLRRAPALEHIRMLTDVGLPVPECVEIGPSARAVPVTAVPARLARLSPWGWAPRVRTQLEALFDRVDEPPPPAVSDALLHAKTSWAPIRGELMHELDEGWLDTEDTLAVVATHSDEVWAALEAIVGRGYARVVIKAPFGTSGRNAQRIDATGPTEAQRRWVARILASQGQVLLEPWLDRVCDVSLRFMVDAEGRTHRLERGRFLTDPRGQYLGAILAPLTRAVPANVARMLHGDGVGHQRLDRVMSRVAARVAEVVHGHGYAGPVGVDGLVYRDLDGALRLRPLVEVNVRPTLGHIADGLARRLDGGSTGLFLLVRLSDLPAGLDLPAAVELAQRALPTVMAARPRRLRRGVVPTTDPAQARGVGTLLLVAPSRAETLRALEAAAPVLAERVVAALG